MDASDHQQGNHPEAARKEKASGATILVIEDEDTVREVLRITLEHSGFRVLAANGGNEALDLCEMSDKPIDLVLTDIVMPGTSGMDLASYLAIRYSSSQVDHRKVGKLAMAIQVAFQELGVFPASGTAVPLQAEGTIPPNTIQMLENVQQTSSIGRIVSPPQGILGGSAENGEVAALQKELEKALAPEIFKKDVALRHEPDGLIISLREVGFFGSGSAQLKPNAIPTLRRVTSVLLERPYEIRIEGHTDNVPIHTPEFASNWELSTARAIEVVRLLISDMGFTPGRLSVGGYGEFHPIALNTTDEQRALNRRVDIVILKRSILAAQAADSAGSTTHVAFPEIGLPRVVPELPGATPLGKPSPAHLPSAHPPAAHTKT